MSMESIKKILFREPQSGAVKSALLLIARIVFGLMFLSHGIAKWVMFNDYAQAFPDPIGIGGTLSFWLAVFAEIVCSLGFIIGALYRLCLIPMIFTMLVAFLIIHAGDPFSVKELALMYLTIFVLMFMTGPGKYSIDACIEKYMK